MNTYLFNATQHNDRPRWRSGYFIGKWAGRYWVRISVPAPTQSIKQCLVLAKFNKSKFVGSWAWRDQPIDQVGPFLTSRLHELRAAVVYCQWQCTLLPWLNHQDTIVHFTGCTSRQTRCIIWGVVWVLAILQEVPTHTGVHHFSQAAIAIKINK